jgi:hypothetical protein
MGNVRVGWKGEDATRETLELVSVEHLSPETLAKVRAQALELEQRAYERSKDVYARTSPAEGPATAVAAPSGGTTAQPGGPAAPASLPRTGGEAAQRWRIELLLVVGLSLGAVGWFVRRRAARR